MIKLSNKYLITAATTCNKTLGKDPREYVNYIVCEKSIMYVTDSKILFAIPAPEGMEDGYYTVLKKTKKEIQIIKVQDGVNVPNYDAVLNDINGYQMLTDAEYFDTPDLLAYKIAIECNACYAQNYLKAIIDLDLIDEIMIKDNTNALKISNDAVKIAIMPLKVE